MSSPCACTQARATCPGVTSFSPASSSTTSTIRTFASRLSPCKRGCERRKSLSSSWSRGAHGASQEPAAERAIGHEPDLELAKQRQDLGLGLARPDRVFGLKRGDRV